MSTFLRKLSCSSSKKKSSRSNSTPKSLAEFPTSNLEFPKSSSNIGSDNLTTNRNKSGGDGIEQDKPLAFKRFEKLKNITKALHRFKKEKTPSAKLKSIFRSVPTETNTYELNTIVSDFKSLNCKQKRTLEFLYVQKLVECESENKYLIDGKWFNKYRKYLSGETLRMPGEITNDEIFQGVIFPTTTMVAVNEFLWRFLICMYGGGPEVPMPKNENSYVLVLTEGEVSTKSFLTAAPWILENIKKSVLAKRREKELEFLKKHENDQTDLYFLVSQEEMEKVWSYLRKDTRDPPETLSNKEIQLKIQNGKLKANEFQEVNATIWRFLTKMYSAGPAIPVVREYFVAQQTDLLYDFEDCFEEICRKRESNFSIDEDEDLPINSLSTLTRGILNLQKKESRSSIEINFAV